MTQQQVTHFKYVCRVCKQELLQPVLQEDPAATPHPACCGSVRNMAYKGVHTDGQGQQSATVQIDTGGAAASQAC